MRTLALVAGGVGASALVALLAFGGHSPRRSKPSPPPTRSRAPWSSPTPERSRGPASRSSSATTSTPASTRSSASTATTRWRSRRSRAFRRSRPAWAATWSSAAATAAPRRRSRSSVRPGPRRSRSNGCAFTTSPRHAHFPHQRHIKVLGPNACTTCHGDVERMPQVFKVNNVNNMGFCITCHVERKVSRDCSVCHY